LKWSRDKYNTQRNKGLSLAYSLHNARKKLLTTCQHNITGLSDWNIYRCHSQLRQSSCLNLSFLWFIEIELKQIFYTFFYYSLGQHCCLTVASIIGNYHFLFFMSFHCPQHFYFPPCLTDVFRCPWSDVIWVLRYRWKLLKLNTFTTQQKDFCRSKMNLVMYLQWCNRPSMNNLKHKMLDYSTAKKYGLLDWRRAFCDWSISRHSIWKVIPSRHVAEYNTPPDNALHTHIRKWSMDSMDWNRGAAACLVRYVQRDT